MIDNPMANRMKEGTHLVDDLLLDDLRDGHPCGLDGEQPALHGAAAAELGRRVARMVAHALEGARCGGGWQSVVDAETTRTYYFHQSTNRTSWTLPPAAAHGSSVRRRGSRA